MLGLEETGGLVYTPENSKDRWLQPADRCCRGSIVAKLVSMYGY